MKKESKFLLNMPDVLYGLQVNEDFTDVEIKEIKLLPYPKLEDLTRFIDESSNLPTGADLRKLGMSELVDEFKINPFDKLLFGNNALCIEGTRVNDKDSIVVNKFDYYFPLAPNTLYCRILQQRILLTHETLLNRNFVKTSIINGNLGSIAESLQVEIRCFQEYAKKIENKLKENGLDYAINDDDSKKDLFIVRKEFYVNEKPFIRLTLKLGNSTIFSDDICEADKFKLEIDCLDEYFQNKTNRLNDNNNLDNVLLSGDQEKKVEIAKQINKVFKANISEEDILFDMCDECYFLKKEIERSLLKEILPERVEPDFVLYKYTSFETLQKILDNKSVLMNSIVSMNDKTETDFMKPYLHNVKGSNDIPELDVCISASRKFIISFTAKEDNLDMWRFYGDNARGVSIGFKFTPNKGKVYKIKYVDENDKTLVNIKKVLKRLKKDLNFKFEQLIRYKHFIKHKDYETEEEYRYLENSIKPIGWFINDSNGILTPFISKNIFTEQNENEKFPFSLSKIIVGPAMPERAVNICQIYYRLSFCATNDVELQISKIESYR